MDRNPACAASSQSGPSRSHRIGAFNIDGNTRAGAFRNAPTFGNFGGNARGGDFTKVGSFGNAGTGAFGLFQKSWCVPGNTLIMSTEVDEMLVCSGTH